MTTTSASRSTVLSDKTPAKELELDMTAVTAFLHHDGHNDPDEYPGVGPLSSVRAKLWRRNSCSSIPPTPPPFARYFNFPVAKPNTSRVLDISAPRSNDHETRPVAKLSPSKISSQRRREPFKYHRPSPSSPAALAPQTTLPPPLPSVTHVLQGTNRASSPPKHALSMETSTILGRSASNVDLAEPVADANETPSTSFRHRRARAAKLAKFFGVGYGELFPPATESDHVNEKRKLKKKNIFEGVSVTVQQSVWFDDELPASAPPKAKTFTGRSAPRISEESAEIDEDWEFGMKLAQGASWSVDGHTAGS